MKKENSRESLTDRQASRSTVLIDAGFGSAIIADEIGCRPPLISKRIPSGSAGSRARLKDDTTLFRTKRGQQESSLVLNLYRTAKGESLDHADRWEKPDLDALMACYQYAKCLFGDAVFTKLDINNAKAVIDRFIEGELNYVRCVNSSCRGFYLEPNHAGLVMECPYCSDQKLNREIVKQHSKMTHSCKEHSAPRQSSHENSLTQDSIKA